VPRHIRFIDHECTVAGMQTDPLYDVGEKQQTIQWSGHSWTPAFGSLHWSACLNAAESNSTNDICLSPQRIVRYGWTRGWGVGLVYGLGLVKLGRGKCDFFRLLMGWVECGYECQMLKERSEVSADVIIIIIAI